MKLLERLERAGWQFKDKYADLDILTRNEQGLLYDPKKDEIRLVYGEGIKPYKPLELDIELLCQDFKVKPIECKKKMIYAHFYGTKKGDG
jgi:hypothetical protein